MDSRDLTENIKSINAGIGAKDRVVTRRTQSGVGQNANTTSRAGTRTGGRTTSASPQRMSSAGAVTRPRTSADSMHRRSQNTRQGTQSRKQSTTKRPSDIGRMYPDRRASRNRRRGARSSSRGFNLFGKSIVSAVIAVIFILVAVSGAIGYAMWYNSFENIRLSEYASITLSGYNGFGEAELVMTPKPGYEEFFSEVEASLDIDDKLSNGDEITISYKYDEELAEECKLRVDDASAQVTVEGLPDAMILTGDDIVKGLAVTFDGIAPCVTVSVENTSDTIPEKNIIYSIVDDKTFYDVGDEIVVEVQIPDEDRNNHAYDFQFSDSDLYVKYKIPSGDRYFTDASQVTPEMLTELEQVGYRLIAESNAKEYGLRIFQGEVRMQPLFVGNSTTFSWSNPYVISAYFHNVTQEGKALRESHANDVQIVYGVTLNQADGASVLTEMVIQFVDLKEMSDGTIDLNTSSGRIVSASHKDSNIKSLVTDEGDGVYITTKIAGE